MKRGSDSLNELLNIQQFYLVAVVALNENKEINTRHRGIVNDLEFFLLLHRNCSRRFNAIPIKGIFFEYFTLRNTCVKLYKHLTKPCLYLFIYSLNY